MLPELTIVPFGFSSFLTVSKEQVIYSVIKLLEIICNSGVCKGVLAASMEAFDIKGS